GDRSRRGPHGRDPLRVEPTGRRVADLPAGAAAGRCGLMRIVHYVNQFYAGLGGEDSAGIGPRVLDGTVGPGRLLAQLLGDEHQIVATLVCGDDHAASNAAVAQELLEMARSAHAELL